MLRTVIFFAACILIGAAEIVQLDSKSYQKDVMDRVDPWTIFFYDSTMISDEDAMGQMLEKLEESVKPYGIGLGKVDCADIKGNRATRKICMNAGLQTIPAVGFVTEIPSLNPYTQKLGREMKLYTGGDPTDIKKIERSLIAKNYPTINVKSIKSTSGDIEGELNDLLEEAGDALVYFSSKDSVTLFTKSICYAFSKMSCITVGGMSSEEITEKFHVDGDSLPLLLVRPKEGDASVYPRSSDLDTATNRDRADVLEWVVKITGYSFEAEDSESNDTAKKGSSSSSSGAPKDLGTAKFPASEFKGESLGEDESWVLLVSDGGYGALASEDEKTSWKKLVGAAEGAVRAGEVDCSGVSGSGLGAILCKERALPFMVMVPAGDEDERSEVLSSPMKKSNLYDLSDAAKAKSAALNSLPDNINYVGEGDLDAFMMMNAQSDRMGLLVMSDKTEAPPMLRNVHYVLEKEGIANLGFLSEPSAQFVASLNMPPDLPMPAVFMLTIAKENPEGTPEGRQATSLTPFDPGMFGPLKFRSLLNFIMSVYQNSGYAERHHQQGRQPGTGDNDSNGGADSTFGDISSAGAADPVNIASQDDWDRECDASFRGICVLAFAKKGTEDQISSINTAVITKLGKAGAAFKFLVINGPCQLSFAERFDVSFDMMPAYAVYSPSKGRTVSFKESISTEKVYLFLDAVLGGRATTYALAQRPTLSQECELDENDADSMPVEEEPMDDFLEEIRREEEEKAAVLAKELKEEQKKRKEEEKKKAEEAKAAPKKVKKVIKKKKSKKSEL